MSQSELERYERQILIEGWGIEGQKRLKASKVAVVGVGGLGCTSSIYLALAGVGKIILVDKDRVSLSDLNRQILYSHLDFGKYKAEVAKVKLNVLNPEVEVQALVKEVTPNNISDLLGNVDVVVDGLDNWKTRFIINEYCVKKGIPFVHAGVLNFYGQITTIVPGKGPCLRCIFPREPKESGVIQVFGAIPAFMASLQVVEVIKILIKIGSPVIGKIIYADGEELSFETIEVKRNPDCPVCGFLKD